MAKEFKSKSRTYLRINKDGLLYVKSKEPREGYEEVVLKNGASVYHKTFGSTDDGYISYIGISEKEFPTGKVKLLEIAIEGDEGSDQVTFDLFKQNGNLTDYVKNIATLLPNIDFSRKINLVPSRKKKDGYVIRNVFFNYPDAKSGDDFVKFAHKYGENGDIPSAEPVTSVDGNVKYDFTKQDTFLYNVLQKEIERFKNFKGVNSTPNTDVPSNLPPKVKTQLTATAPNLENTNHDDLPF